MALLFADNSYSTATICKPTITRQTDTWPVTETEIKRKSFQKLIGYAIIWDNGTKKT